MMNIQGLAYVVAQTTDMAKWRTYAEGVLGMMAQPGPDGGLYVKMDERQFRMAVQRGERDAQAGQRDGRVGGGHAAGQGCAPRAR